MTQRPRTSISTPPSAYRYPWTHPANASDPALTLGLGRPQTTRHHSDRFGIHTPRRSTQPVHYPPSSDMYNQDMSGPSTPKTAMKVLTSVKRSFSSAVTKKSSGPSATLTGSTAEEAAAAQIRMTELPSSSKPPTVQQIAAGLVTGLRPNTRTPLTRQTSAPLPPPPARSSLKKPLNSGASSSSSTSLASTSLMSTSTRTGSTTTAATSVASSRRARPRFSLKDALFGRSGSSSPTPIVTLAPKAVRFHVDRSPVVEPTSLPPT
ncbi:hypothetical protein FRC07_010852 [Ceratobasidium sp. 392]|nr:hypothetical protein FRC07_010852 [Ceratobasidium sp. 392]